MMKDNLRFKMKQSDVLHPILEFVIGGGTTFISTVFCMWLCQFSCVHKVSGGAPCKGLK